MTSKQFITKLGRKCKNAAPMILTIVGSGGVIATAVMAVKATPKALKLISDEECRNPQPLTKLDITKLCWTVYVPSVIIGATTITCIFGANLLNQRQQASIISLYGAVDQSYKRYRKASGEVYGEDAMSRIDAQVAKDMYIYSGADKIYSPEFDSESDKVLFYDIFSGRYFQSTVASVINAQYHLNRMWVLQGEVTMNEFYGFLGVDHISGGDEVGWTYDYAESGYAWIDFNMSEVEIDGGLECFVISTPFGPDPINWSTNDAENEYNK